MKSPRRRMYSLILVYLPKAAARRTLSLPLTHVMHIKRSSTLCYGGKIRCTCYKVHFRKTTKMALRLFCVYFTRCLGCRWSLSPLLLCCCRCCATLLVHCRHPVWAMFVSWREWCTLSITKERFNYIINVLLILSIIVIMVWSTIKNKVSSSCNKRKLKLAITPYSSVFVLADKPHALCVRLHYSN